MTSANYRLLTKLHEDYKDKGFDILAFPCNQFFSQENGSHEEIQEFVRTKYHSKFVLFEKASVNGTETHPVYKYLRANS